MKFSTILVSLFGSCVPAEQNHIKKILSAHLYTFYWIMQENSGKRATFAK